MGWDRDSRGKFIAYKLYAKNDADEQCEFTVRYLTVERNHNMMKKDGVFSSFPLDDQPTLPPKNNLKDMVDNQTNVTDRGDALRVYFSHLFASEVACTHPTWSHVFNPEVEDSEGEEEAGQEGGKEEDEDWLTKGSMQVGVFRTINLPVCWADTGSVYICRAGC